MTTEDIEKYKKMVDDTAQRLRDSCAVWTREIDANESQMTEEIIQKIQSVIGKSQLLINSKFKQFRGFLTDAETKTIGKVVKFDDIRGFWETICIQVDEVDAVFRELELAKKNNYETTCCETDGIFPSSKKSTSTVKKPTTTAVKKPAVSASSNLKSFITAQRERKKLDGICGDEVVHIAEKVPSNGHA